MYQVSVITWPEYRPEGGMQYGMDYRTFEKMSTNFFSIAVVSSTPGYLLTYILRNVLAAFQHPPWSLRGQRSCAYLNRCILYVVSSLIRRLFSQTSDRVEWYKRRMYNGAVCFTQQLHHPFCSPFNSTVPIQQFEKPSQGKLSFRNFL